MYIILLYAFHGYFITHKNYQAQLSWVFHEDHGNSMDLLSSGVSADVTEKLPIVLHQIANYKCWWGLFYRME